MRKSPALRCAVDLTCEWPDSEEPGRASYKRVFCGCSKAYLTFG
jgi:hypothetical protein